MATFLLILKIIGITILIILGIILFLILIVLFVPIRYTGHADKEDGENGKFNAGAGVTWLLRIVNARYDFEDGKGRLVIRIFGFRLKDEEEKRAARQKREEKKRLKREKQEKKKEKNKRDKEVTYTMIEYDENEGDFSQHNVDLKEGPGIKEENVPVPKTSLKDRLEALFNRIKDKISGVFGKVKSIYDKAGEKAADIEYYADALSNDAKNRQAIEIIVKQLKKLLRSIRPRKLKGYVDYGGEDPAATGRVMAIAAMAYPVYSPGLKVNPDFENQVLDFDVNIKGRVYIAVVLKVLAVLYFNKKVKRFIRIMKKENDNGR